MKKILLLCAAGMSTSLLVSKMKTASKETNVEVEIEASSVENFRENINKYDVFLLGPQVRFKQKELDNLAKEHGKRVEVIDMRDYGMMNGKKVLDKSCNQDARFSPPCSK